MADKLVSNIVKIPIEFKSDFDEDPIIAWSSFGDTPQESEFPYFENRDAIRNMVDHSRINPINEDLEFDPNFRCLDDFYRFLHIDLSHTGDFCGISMCHVSDWIKRSIDKKDADGNFFVTTDYLPFFTFDFLCSIEPKGSEVIFSDVREIVYECYRRGFPIMLITFDRFQSVDCMQILRRGTDTVPGFICANLSLDRTANYPVVDLTKRPYLFRKESTGTGQHSNLAVWNHLKTAINTERISIPFYKPVTDTSLYNDFVEGENQKKDYDDLGKRLPDTGYITLVEQEAFSATFDSKALKVKEAPRSSIDLLESIGGAIFNANNNVVDRTIEETPQQKRFRQAKELSGAETEFDREDISHNIEKDNDDTDNKIDNSDDSIFDEDNREDNFYY